MALLFCYQSFNIASWLKQACNQLSRSSSFKESDSGPGVHHYQNWPELLLSLFYTVEVPLIASFHPMITSASIVCAVDVVPSDYQLLCQMVVFIITDNLMHPFFLKYYPLYSIEKPMDALGLATDVTVQHATLVTATGIVQRSNRSGHATGIGQLHIVALGGWVLFQQLSKVSNMSAFGCAAII